MNKFATNCEHKDRLEKARGLCSNCYDKVLYAENPERVRNIRNAAHRRWRYKNKGADNKYQRSYSLRTKYGIGVEQYDKALEAQHGVCAICGKPEPQVGKSLPVDHCHVTGRVRGLLCSNCNNGIGRFQDDPLILRKAALYLENSNGSFILEPIKT